MFFPTRGYTRRSFKGSVSMPQKPAPPFIPEFAKRQRHADRVTRFTGSPTIAAGMMLAAAIVSIIIANTDAYAVVDTMWQRQIGVFFGDSIASISLLHFVNNLLMAVFFLSVGLEIKREVTVGDLADVRKALLPVLAAVGGVLMPIAIYLLLNHGTAYAQGWGVPTATDIGFALGILALLGKRVPAGVRLFLSTLAIADDIIAILIIAVFYGESPSIPWLVAAGLVFVALMTLNRARVHSLAPYILLGFLLWICLLFSGIHTTIAGVLLALTIPTTTQVNMGVFGKWVRERLDDARDILEPDTPILAQGRYTKAMYDINQVTGHVAPPLVRLNRAIAPWVSFLVLPLFALANAGVRVVGEDPVMMLTNTAALGIFFGLFLGKPLGIMAMSLIAVKSGLCKLPSGVNWRHMLGAAMLGGVGFTMAIFVTNLAFPDSEVTTIAKAAILAASVLSGLCGYLLLRSQAVRDARRETALQGKSDK
jgi:NhaA family Na+:H+ antiporter